MILFFQGKTNQKPDLKQYKSRSQMARVPYLKKGNFIQSYRYIFLISVSVILWMPNSFYEASKEMKRNLAAFSLVFSLTALVTTWAKMIETLHIYVTMFYKVLKTIFIAFVSDITLETAKKHPVKTCGKIQIFFILL